MLWRWRVRFKKGSIGGSGTELVKSRFYGAMILEYKSENFVNLLCLKKKIVVALRPNIIFIISDSR